MQKVDRGKGVLLLVDMGSLASFGDYIAKKTGITIRTVTRVDTLMVIDAVRKVLLPEADINEVASSLIRGKPIKNYPYEDRVFFNPETPAIISICLTGEGTAQQIDNLIKDEVHKINKNIKIVTLGVLDERDILEQINKLRRNLNILAIIGTINPEHPEIPFISSADVIKGMGLSRLLNIVKLHYQENNTYISNMGITTNSVLELDNILVGKEINNKVEVIKNLVDILVDKGCVYPNFINGVLEREKLGSTAIGNSLAIPHGYGGDIISPAIAIMTLKSL